MAEPDISARLYIEADLISGASVAVSSDQAHYLRNVLRLAKGAQVAVFNGHDGEWTAQIAELTKKSCLLDMLQQTRQQTRLPDVWLLFAPIKKLRIDYLVQKATELGASVLQPVITDYTQMSRVNTDRLRANCIEAAEQCNCLSVPDVHEPAPLSEVLDGLGNDRQLLFCDEAGGTPVVTALSTAAPGPWAILIGPEGGFSPAERDLLLARGNSLRVSLGPRIMRADTAAIAALALWQAHLGDWGRD